MKRKIRYGVFETNSSQCHAISVARVRDSKLVIPETLVFSADCFITGNRYMHEDEIKEITDTQGKADFLYSALREKYMKSNPRLYKSFLKFIEKALNEVGVKNVVFEDTTYTDGLNRTKPYIGDTGVEFSDKFFSDLIYNPRRLRSFLFSSKSVIESARDDEAEISTKKNTEDVSYGWKWYASY